MEERVKCPGILTLDDKGSVWLALLTYFQPQLQVKTINTVETSSICPSIVIDLRPVSHVKKDAKFLCLQFTKA